MPIQFLVLACRVGKIIYWRFIIQALSLKLVYCQIYLSDVIFSQFAVFFFCICLRRQGVKRPQRRSGKLQKAFWKLSRMSPPIRFQNQASKRPGQVVKKQSCVWQVSIFLGTSVTDTNSVNSYSAFSFQVLLLSLLLLLCWIGHGAHFTQI